jgi:hypothetical protein
MQNRCHVTVTYDLRRRRTNNGYSAIKVVTPMSVFAIAIA